MSELIEQHRNNESWMTEEGCHERHGRDGIECGGRQMFTRKIIQTYKHTKRGKRQGEGTSQEKYLRTCTSILRPSTTVPCNFSLALSASTLCSNVTNPKPCMQDRKRQEKHAYYLFMYLFICSIFSIHIISYFNKKQFSDQQLDMQLIKYGQNIKVPSQITRYIHRLSTILSAAALLGWEIIAGCSWGHC